MMHKYILKSREAFEEARIAFESMKLSRTTHEMARQWKSFVERHNVAMSRLIKATEAGKSKAWCDLKLKNARKTDDLLSYLHQARNAEEHGIEEITEQIPGMIIIGGPGESMSDVRITIDGGGVRGSYRSERPVTIADIPGHVRLIPVANRGVTYQPPTLHSGNAIDDRSPVGVAKLGLDYLEQALAHAEGFFGQAGTGPANPSSK